MKEQILADYLSELPDYVFEFVEDYYPGDSINSKLAYVVDIRIFFKYLLSLSEYKERGRPENITPEDLDTVSLEVLGKFKAHLKKYNSSYYTCTGKLINLELTNDEKGIIRKLSTLRTLYSFLFKSDRIKKNITEKLPLPRIRHKIKKPLSTQDTLKVIDVFYNGEKYFQERELQYYLANRQRDITILTTLLGTGIRVSELVGLNIEDIDFETSTFLVKRKGGEYEQIIMPIQVENELCEYIKHRLKETTKDTALFITNRKTRITVSTIEKMVKRYCDTAGIYQTDKRTVHALRRTFACNLLSDGVDLKAVSQLLGHKDITVTSRFYAQHSDERLKAIMKNRRLPGNMDNNAAPIGQQS